MHVPFLNLAAQHASLREPLLAAVTQTLERGVYILGPEVEALEKEIAALAGAAFGIGVNSGSDALTLALHGLNVGQGDEVITSPFTYIAPAEAIHQVGARVVFADIHPRTFNINPDQLTRRLTSRTRAVIPVHLFGQCAPLDEYREVSKRGLHVIEDCAQAIGALRHGRPAGGTGVAGCFSFYPTKNLGADGDGGMIVVRDEALAKRLRMLRVHGISRRYHHDFHGFNSRLDELQAAILRVKVKRLAEWNRRRGEIAARYDRALEGLPVERPLVEAGNEHVFHVYALLTDRRDALQTFLADAGVATLIYYPMPLHLQKVYADLGYKPGDFPVAEAVSKRILPLPMYPELTNEQVDYVAERIRAFFS
jgi:dTDP-4-amino-4,6-dideoxygalactose transaminase